MKKLKYFYWKNCKTIKQVALLLFIAIFLIGYSFYSYITYIKKASLRTDSAITISNNPAERKITGNLAAGQKLEQTFVGDSKGISAIEISCATNGKQNAGILNVSLVDNSTGTVIEQWKKKGSKVKDNSNIKFKLKNEIRDSVDKMYSIVVHSTDNALDDEIYLYQAIDDSYGAGVCIANEVQQEDIVFNVYPASIDNTFIVKIFCIICIMQLLLCVYIWYRVVYKQCYTVESIFVPFMLVLGLVYMCVLPPFSAPDETVHYVGSYYISNQILGVDNPSEDFVTCRESDNSSDVFARTPTLNSYRYFYENIFTNNEKTDNNSTCQMASLMDFTLVSHFPQAIGITVARLYHMSYAALLFMGRFFSLIFYIVLVYLAIKITPIGKLSLFALSGLPIMLHEVASFGYDGVVCAFAFLLTAYILKLIYEKKTIEWKDMIVVIVLSVLLSPCKMVYFLIPFLVILIPRKKFKSSWYRIGFTIATIGIATITAVAGNLSQVSKSSSGENIIAWANEEGFTVSYVLTHIPQTILMYVSTFHEKMEFYTDSLIGGNLSWFDVDIPADLTMFSLVLLVLSIHEYRQHRMKTSHRIVYIGVFVCVAVLVCATMLLGWTPKSYGFIEGVQGRYFLPAMPLLLIPLVNSTKQQESMYRKIVIMGTCIVNYLVVLRIVETIVMR